MANTNKPEKPKTTQGKVGRSVKKDSELSEDELKKISGGPTAVEMPGRVTQ